MNLAVIRKAILGGFLTAIAYLIPAARDGSLSATEIGGTVLAFIGGLGGVYAIPNRPQARRPAGDRGAADLLVLLVVVVLILAVFFGFFAAHWLFAVAVLAVVALVVLLVRR